MKAKYNNPYTDFGFKKILGEEGGKPLLKDFPNALLPEQNKIIDLTFKNTGQPGLTDLDCKGRELEQIAVSRSIILSVTAAFSATLR